MKAMLIHNPKKCNASTFKKNGSLRDLEHALAALILFLYCYEKIPLNIKQSSLFILFIKSLKILTFKPLKKQILDTTQLFPKTSSLGWKI